MCECDPHKYVHQEQSTVFWAAGAFFYFLYYFSVISAQDREPAESQNALNSVGLIKSAQLGSLSPGENQPQSVVVRSERCGFQQRAARCPISDQIANKAPQLGDEPEKHSKKKKEKKRLSVLLVCRRTDSRADSGPGGLCPNTVRTGSSIWSFAVWTKLCSVFNPLNLFKAVAF